MFETALDHYAIRKRVTVYCESHGYRVQFLEEGDQPRADSRGTIYITSPLPAWTEEQLLEWEWSVYHEIGHQVPEMRDIFPLMTEKKISCGVKDPELLPALLNILDDYRQERHDHGVYLGRDKVLSKGLAQYMKLKSVPESKKWDMTKFSDKMLRIDSAYGAINKVRSSWQKDVIGLDDQYMEHFTPQQKEWADKIVSDYSEEIDNLQTAEDVYDLTKRIIDEVFKLDPEEEEKKAQEQTKQQKAGGQGGQGEGEGQCPTNGDGEGGDEEGQAQGAQGKYGKGDKKREQDAYVKYEDIAMHYETGDGPSYHSLTIDYSNYGHYDGDYVPSLENRIYDFANKSGVPNQQEHYKSQVMNLDLSNGLANVLRRELQVRSQATKIYGQKSGKVSNKSVHRVTMRDSGEYQRKIFKKKIENNILDTAVTVLCDFSGSMGGSKIAHAIGSALMLNDSLDKIGVPVAIEGFTTCHVGSELYIFKEHNKRVSHDKLLSYMCRATYNMAGNADGEAILWSYDRLRHQKNKRKLLIVLSDGQPAGGNIGDIYGFTKEVVKQIEEKKDVEIYGIGIQSNAVNNIYKHRRVIRNTSDLEPAILNVIRNYILEK